MNNFKDIIAYLRKREGLTQRELAEKLNVSKSVVGMWEAGTRYPSREVEENIADFFNVDLDFLRGYSRDIARPDEYLFNFMSDDKKIKINIDIQDEKNVDVDMIRNYVKMLFLALGDKNEHSED